MKVSVRDKVIALMKDGRERTTPDIYNRLGCSHKYASNVISDLLREGRVASEYLDHARTKVYKWVHESSDGPGGRDWTQPFTEEEYAAAMLHLAFNVEKRPQPRLPEDGSANYGVQTETAKDRRAEMLDYIREQHPTATELTEAFAVSRQTVGGDIKALRREGVISNGKRPVRYAVQDRMAAE